MKPANILINDRQEIEWIDFEQEMYSEALALWMKTENPIIQNGGTDTDTFSFIITFAKMMSELLKGSAVSKEARPLFQELRDGYLDLILEKLPEARTIRAAVNRLHTSPKGSFRRAEANGRRIWKSSCKNSAPTGTRPRKGVAHQS